MHTLKLFFTLSHTLPLHDFHLNTGFLNVELQANWHGIKPTKCLIKFTLTIVIINPSVGGVGHHHPFSHSPSSLLFLI